MQNKTIALAIVGATCSGKTALSAELLSEMRGEIISADSRQIYRFLTIGTAKPERDLLDIIPHHFIDTLNPDEYFSAGEFGNIAAQILEKIGIKAEVPVIVGGSGLYVKSLCDGLFHDDLAEADTLPHRLRLEEKLAEEGISALYEELRRVDAVSAERYNDMNPRRIIRALEYFYATKTPLSEAHTLHPISRPFTTLYFGLDFEREELYKRINQRTEEMFRQGIIEETEAVLGMGYSPTLNSLNTVGYKECMRYLRGEISKTEAIELTKQNTRRFAKRQLTWFRRNSAIEWLHGDVKSIAKLVINKYIAVREQFPM